MKNEIILAGGCYWNSEAIFKHFSNINNIKSGHYHLDIKNDGFTDTDKLETIYFSYDTNNISFSKILDIFFFTHNPTLIKWDINDCFYPLARSAIIYHNEEQKNISLEYIKNMTINKIYTDSINTKLIKFNDDNFTLASDKNQNFYEKNPKDPYCTSIIEPKIIKLKKEFKSFL